MSPFLRNIERLRLAEHEARMDATPGKALPKQDTPQPAQHTAEHMAMMREHNRLRMQAARATPEREALKARCAELRNAGWLTSRIASELGITPHRVGHLLRGVE